jgi:RNA polymerase sigma-70 factor (ECF subfamily)
MDMATPNPLPVASLASDADIVARVVSGDRAVFEVLMRRHNTRVYRTIRAILRDEAEVEDAMQQTYLQAFRHLDGFAGSASFSTWLTRIAMNEALGRLRKRVRLVALHQDGDAGAPIGTEDGVMSGGSPVSPEDEAAARETMRILERAIDRLPPIHRSVIMLRDVEQLSTSEAAEALGIGEEAVRIRLHRARAALRDVYAEEIGRGASQAFPFHAPRCDRVVAAVMEALGASSATES